MILTGDPEFLPLPWLFEGARASAAVGLLTNRNETGKLFGVSTGVLLDGEVVDQTLAGLPLFFTQARTEGVRDEPAEVQFFDMGGTRSTPRVYRIEMTIATWQPRAATEAFRDAREVSRFERPHYAVYLLESWPQEVAPAAVAPEDSTTSTEARISIVGFPDGKPPAQVGLSSEVIRSDQNSLHYRAPTVRGFGGAAIFNGFWEVIGLHMGFVSLRNQESYNWGSPIGTVLSDARDNGQPPSLGVRERILETKPEREHIDIADVRYQSVFISYSHDDRAFARRLYRRLTERGVEAWFDEEQLLPGDLFERAIQRGMERSQRCIVCLSESYLSDERYAEHELEGAFMREREVSRELGESVSFLIPVDLDGYVHTGWRSKRETFVKKRAIADFTRWKIDTDFEKAMEKLLEALRPRK